MFKVKNKGKMTTEYDLPITDDILPILRFLVSYPRLKMKLVDPFGDLLRRDPSVIVET